LDHVLNGAGNRSDSANKLPQSQAGKLAVTQILSLIFAARFKRPVPILFATIANHAAAGLAGDLFGSLLAGRWMRWILGLSFLSVAVWVLFPDKFEGDVKMVSRRGAFVSTLIAFFCGDRRGDADRNCRPCRAFRSLLCGRRRHTFGMMLANIPAVILGDRLAGKLSGKATRIAAAVLFGLLGVLTLVEVRLQLQG
jgi:Ca2+/H+ antiporter, TMEM165/GDT1 family